MRSLRDKIEIEPLAERRWAAVCDAVLARAAEATAPRGRPGTWLALGAAAAGLCAVVALALVGRRDPEAPPASRIVTEAEPVELVTARATLAIGPRSAVRVGREGEQAPALTLEHGTVECDVRPAGPDAPFVVVAGEVRVEVLGTRFWVRRIAGVEVGVRQGVVRVVAGQESAVLHAGDRWPPPPEAAPAAVPPPPEAPGPPRREPRPAPARSKPAAPPPSTAAAAAAPPAAAAPSDQERYETAARLERRDPEAALRIYGELARGGGPWAANALFARARLEAERGNTAEARRLAEEYLRRFPAGPNAPDSRALLAR